MFTASTMGLPLRKEDVGHLLVRGGEARADIRQKDDDSGVLDGDLGLIPHEGQDLVVGPGLDTAGVDKGEGPAVPVRLPIDAVPGDARVSSTMERRFPMSLLNSMDLPTLGRPTMATMGFTGAHFPSLSSRHTWSYYTQ